jgi:hypothetical protein
VTILVVAGLLIAVMSSCSGFLNLGPVERKHLAQIPIDKRACPYVVAMHQTANAFQSAEPLFDSYVGPGIALIDPPWPRVRTRIRTTLMDLQLSILVGRAHFPPAVRRRLNVTLDAIHSGLRELAHARSTDEMTTKTSAVLAKGQSAFGYAGDLVGTQCEVKLGADSALAQPTPQDLADYACQKSIRNQKFVNAQPTTVGKARALRGAGIIVTHPLARAFPHAKASDFAALCWKRAQYEYISYATDFRGHAAMIATRAWSGKACKHAASRPHTCIPPLPTPPPGAPRSEI